MNSKRFRPSWLSRWLVPALMILLLALMLSAFVLVVLSVFGFKFGPY